MNAWPLPSTAAQNEAEGQDTEEKSALTWSGTHALHTPLSKIAVSPCSKAAAMQKEKDTHDTEPT